VEIQVVTCSPLDSNRAEVEEFLRAIKIHSITFFGREVKWGVHVVHL
jgi:hypothetical protein